MAKDLITYTHKGVEICVRRHWNRTLLLIGGEVADEWRGIVEVSYHLHGKIGSDQVEAALSILPVGGEMCLLINGLQVAQKYKL